MRAKALPLLFVLAVSACRGPSATTETAAPNATATGGVLYEGATLIAGDGSAPVERAAFTVQDGKVTQVGRQGELTPPQGGTRVDLSGSTVMPALVSTHVHVGLLDGMTFGPEVYSHDHIVEHLQRYAFYGLAAVLSPGTDVGPLAFEVRAEKPAGAARLLTAGRGMAAPDGGPGIPSIANTSFPITTAEEGRERVRELAAMKADAVKIWVDDRLGRVKKLTPEIYGPIIAEAHKHGMLALAHVYYLKDAHGLVDAGIDGLMHLVRDEVMDDGLIAKMKGRNVFVAANIGGTRRAGLPEAPADLLALLGESIPVSLVEEYRASYAARDTKNVAFMRGTYGKMRESLRKLNEAGITITLGGDTGIPGAWHGWAEHYELETMVDAGMTPAQVIQAATSNAARVLKIEDLGTIAVGKSADFLVLDADPLQDIKNARKISAVYLRGSALDRSAMRVRWTANKTS
jgi:imidazolonepropionase-like amidohydrolase